MKNLINKLLNTLPRAVKSTLSTLGQPGKNNYPNNTCLDNMESHVKTNKNDKTTYVVSIKRTHRKTLENIVDNVPGFQSATFEEQHGMHVAHVEIKPGMLYTPIPAQVTAA